MGFYENKWGKSGRLKNQNHKTKGNYHYLFHLLYVDDSTFLFETRDEIGLGSQVIHDNCALFGLIMHVGDNGKTPKTEALHPPKKLGETRIPAGEQVSINNGAYFHFTNSITYFRSIVTSCLRDSADITARISKAYGTIGALKSSSSAVKYHLTSN
jgi:hypothetical protein